MLIKRLAVGFAVMVLAVGLLGGCNRDNGSDEPPVVPEQQQDS